MGFPSLADMRALSFVFVVRYLIGEWRADVSASDFSYLYMISRADAYHVAAVLSELHHTQLWMLSEGSEPVFVKSWPGPMKH